MNDRERESQRACDTAVVESMHQNVETWDTECACIDPAWAALQEELEAKARSSS